MLQFAIFHYSILVLQAWALGSVGFECRGWGGGWAEQPSQPGARVPAPPGQTIPLGVGAWKRQTPDHIYTCVLILIYVYIYIFIYMHMYICVYIYICMF